MLLAMLSLACKFAQYQSINFHHQENQGKEVSLSFPHACEYKTSKNRHRVKLKVSNSKLFALYTYFRSS